MVGVMGADMILDAEYYNDYWSDWSAMKEDSERAFHALESLPNTSVLLDGGLQLQGVTLWGSPWGAWPPDLPPAL
jgi:hypothetical protein